MNFYTSDTHFGHARIIELCNRPFASVDEMNEALITNWNQVVSEDSVVYHMGDVAMGPWVEWDSILARLNGYKILVVGNHDRVFGGMSSKQQVKFAPEYAKWFDEVRTNSTVEIDGQEFNLSHFPYDGDSHDEDRFDKFRLVDDGTILLHGHTHSSEIISHSKVGTPQIHVGVDSHSYFPVSQDQIQALLSGMEQPHIRRS